jgi:hypothetical protein
MHPSSSSGAPPAGSAGAFAFAGLAFGNPPFRPLPPPTGQAPYHLSLSAVLPPTTLAAIHSSGRLVFHAAGDTGGVKAPQAQQIVAMKMDDDCAVADATMRPAFFYHLGDVVYYYGETTNYYGQFYEPYSHYPAPILAIPGNHDGDIPPGVTVRSLDAFVRNFCSATPRHAPEAGDAARTTMVQPNVYWTLDAPFLTIIGVYTNVPEGGVVHPDQVGWFTSELRNAPTDKALIVAMHHPIHSVDTHHGASAAMGLLLDHAIQQTGRIPDAVFAGHVHNYQRFTRTYHHRAVPYIVAGAGGYWNLHYVQQPSGQPPTVPYAVPGTDVTLEKYCDDRHGYLRLEVTAQTLTGHYFTVPRPQESWHAPAQLLDTFTLDLQHHRLIP